MAASRGFMRLHEKFECDAAKCTRLRAPEQQSFLFAIKQVRQIYPKG